MPSSGDRSQGAGVWLCPPWEEMSRRSYPTVCSLQLLEQFLRLGNGTGWWQQSQGSCFQSAGSLHPATPLGVLYPRVVGALPLFQHPGMANGTLCPSPCVKRAEGERHYGTGRACQQDRALATSLQPPVPGASAAVADNWVIYFFWWCRGFSRRLEEVIVDTNFLNCVTENWRWVCGERAGIRRACGAAWAGQRLLGSGSASGSGWAPSWVWGHRMDALEPLAQVGLDHGPALAQHMALASCLHPGVLRLHAASPTAHPIAPHTERALSPLGTRVRAVTPSHSRGATVADRVTWPCPALDPPWVQPTLDSAPLAPRRTPAPPSVLPTLHPCVPAGCGRHSSLVSCASSRFPVHHMRLCFPSTAAPRHPRAGAGCWMCPPRATAEPAVTQGSCHGVTAACHHQSASEVAFAP